MRKIKLYIASSLDGYIAREDGSVDWLPTEGDYGYKKFCASIDTILMGRKTYDQILEFGEYPYSGKKAYIFTKNTKTKKDINVKFVSDVIDFTKGLVRSPGKDIWIVGGAEIITIFLNSDLIDEIILTIIPTVIGKGIPLFKDIKKEVKLQLVKSNEYKGGLVQLHYKLSRPQPLERIN
jgi:dihydrofolate reductase